MNTAPLKQIEVQSELAPVDYVAQLNQLPAEARDRAGSAVWAELTESLRTTNELACLAKALV